MSLDLDLVELREAEMRNVRVRRFLRIIRKAARKEAYRAIRGHRLDANLLTI